MVDVGAFNDELTCRAAYQFFMLIDFWLTFDYVCSFHSSSFESIWMDHRVMCSTAYRVRYLNSWKFLFFAKRCYRPVECSMQDWCYCEWYANVLYSGVLRRCCCCCYSIAIPSDRQQVSLALEIEYTVNSFVYTRTHTVYTQAVNCFPVNYHMILSTSMNSVDIYILLMRNACRCIHRGTPALFTKQSPSHIKFGIWLFRQPFNMLSYHCDSCCGIFVATFILLLCIIFNPNNNRSA